MARTVFVGDSPEVVTEWLERRRALGQDGHDATTLHAEIDWPPA